MTADVGQPGDVEHQLLGNRVGLRERRRERLDDRIEAAELTAHLRHAVLAYVRMTAAALGNHRGVKRGGVVGAHKRPSRPASEGDVQEVLVALALDELVRRAPGGDRLAHPPGWLGRPGGAAQRTRARRG